MPIMNLTLNLHPTYAHDLFKVQSLTMGNVYAKFEQ